MAVAWIAITLEAFMVIYSHTQNDILAGAITFPIALVVAAKT